MSASTTNFGPNVAIVPDSVLSERSNLAVLDLRKARVFSRTTTASASSAVLADGEFAITAIGASSAVLAFRSGNTTYLWSSTTADVL